MNGLVIFRKLSLWENIKFKFGIIKIEKITYNEKTVFVYVLPYVNKKVENRLIKKLKKDNIKKVGFENDFENTDFFESEFIVVHREKVFTENLSKIISKLAGVLGVGKGKLKLGICIDKYDVGILSSLKNLKRKLNSIYIYTALPENVLDFADKFYKLTGVSVIVKNKAGQEDMDVLIYKSGDLSKMPVNTKLIFDLTSKLPQSIKCVNDIKMDIPETLREYNVSNGIICELFKLDFIIKSFTRQIKQKTLDTNL